MIDYDRARAEQEFCNGGGGLDVLKKTNHSTSFRTLRFLQKQTHTDLEVMENSEGLSPFIQIHYNNYK